MTPSGEISIYTSASTRKHNNFDWLLATQRLFEKINVSFDGIVSNQDYYGLCEKILNYEEETVTSNALITHECEAAKNTNKIIVSNFSQKIIYKIKSINTLVLPDPIRLSDNVILKLYKVRDLRGEL